MIYILDTDHVSLLQRGGPAAGRILRRMQDEPSAVICLTIISYEEQVRGRLAEVARMRSITEQCERYERLRETLGLYCRAPVLPFDDAAVHEFQRLWLMRLRVGAMDLRIASIALAQNATLLTRNSADFGKVPGLRTEDWSG
jgi:tRNA(fMet)-specific endonuclease VapC